jgi:hypothetical protein
MHRLIKNFSVIFCVALSSITHAQTDAQKFLGLENLVGVWQLTKAEAENEKLFRLLYHFISHDSALVEVYGDPAKQTTETIFHRDGKTLLATHYCARGNQPRLNAVQTLTKNSLEFRFKDITNLSNKNDPHMVRMKFTFIDKDHFQKEEVYLVKGKEELSTMTPVRVN